jgi:predicted transcriptional regulator
MRVQGIMSNPVITCRPADCVKHAAQLMWERDCGTIPVVNDDGQLAGILTDRDVCMAAFTTGSRLCEISVADVMAQHVVCCDPEDSLEAVEHLMRERQIGRVVVVDKQGTPVGVLSLGDIARYALSSQRREVIERQVVQTLAAIRAPRRRTSRPPTCL